MIEGALFVLAVASGAAVGVTVHEAAHYVVLWLGGFEPGFRVPVIKGATLAPETVFAMPEERVPWGVRLAAVAPQAVGLGLTPVLAVVLVSARSPAVLGAAIGCWLWIAKPSKQDLFVVAGRLVTPAEPQS